MEKRELTCRCGRPVEREDHGICDDCFRTAMQLACSEHRELGQPLTSEQIIEAVGRDPILTALWRLWAEPDLAAIEGRECGQPCPPDAMCEECARFWQNVGSSLGALLVL